MLLLLTSSDDDTARKILDNIDSRVPKIVLSEISIDLVKTLPLNKIRVVYNISNYFIKTEENEIERLELQCFMQYFLKKEGVVFYGENYASDFSKEEYLVAAKSCGLNVPEYLYTNSKEELLSFAKKHRSIITKSIKSQVRFQYENEPDNPLYRCYTYELSGTDIMKLPDRFFPSFFQKLIDKKFELKLFYFENKFYPSYLQAETRNIDVRQNDGIVPMPINLEKELEESLQKLMLLLKIKMGTIDLLYGDDGKYYFLEINLGGRYDYISDSCGYNLEKVVADKISSICLT